MDTISSLFSSLGKYLSARWNLFRTTRTVPPPLPVTGNEPVEVMSPRVLVICLDPIMDIPTGQRLSQHQNWFEVQQLITEYVGDVLEVSGGLVKYQVNPAYEYLDTFPLKGSGKSYTPDSYLAVWEKRAKALSPDEVNYHWLLERFRLEERFQGGEFDEVWLFGAPYFGLAESTMAGRGAFFCNGGPIENCVSPRKFVIMGFSYERGVGEMLEDLGHRAETMLGRQFKSLDFWQWTYNRDRQPPTTAVEGLNYYQRFLCFDKVAPGQSNVGTVHYAPNSSFDYKWGIKKQVLSCADDWLLFPNLPEPPNYRQMNCEDWGNGDTRLHHKWWLAHLPKAPGSLYGVRNNWWYYFIDPNHVL